MQSPLTHFVTCVVICRLSLSRGHGRRLPLTGQQPLPRSMGPGGLGFGPDDQELIFLGRQRPEELTMFGCGAMRGGYR